MGARRAISARGPSRCRDLLGAGNAPDWTRQPAGQPLKGTGSTQRCHRGAVFAAQPAQEGYGYTGAEFTRFAGTSGITGAALTTWQQCALEIPGRYETYAANVQTGAVKAGVVTTPSVKLNGQDVTAGMRTPKGLAAAVKAATK